MGNYDADEDERTGYDHTSPRPQADLTPDALIREKLDMMNPASNQRAHFLDAIKQIESSGGKNTEHPIIQGGIHAGQQAIGSYGLMPNTVQELANRAHTRAPASIDAPDIQQKYADQLADHVLNRFQDPSMAAYAWNQGHNLTPEQVKARNYEQHPYVQRFQKIYRSLGGK